MNATPDEIIAALIDSARQTADLVAPGYGELHLRTLLKVRDWACAQQPVQAGDRAELSRDLGAELNPKDSWFHLRHILAKGARCSVREVSFNGARDCWQASVRFDSDPALLMPIGAEDLTKLREEERGGQASSGAHNPGPDSAIGSTKPILEGLNDAAVNSLALGAYRIRWTHGGESTAVVGAASSGRRWFACANWTGVTLPVPWWLDEFRDQIAHLELTAVQSYDPGEP